MKKSMFWLALLMMGVSTALWSGCSDDDNGPGQEEGGGEGNGEGDGDVVEKDTVFQVKTIKIVRVDDGDDFYKLVEFNRAGEELTGLKISNYTDRGINGSPREILLEKKGSQIRLIEDKGGYYEKNGVFF